MKIAIAIARLTGGTRNATKHTEGAGEQRTTHTHGINKYIPSILLCCFCSFAFVCSCFWLSVFVSSRAPFTAAHCPPHRTAPHTERTNTHTTARTRNKMFARIVARGMAQSRARGTNTIGQCTVGQGTPGAACRRRRLSDTHPITSMRYVSPYTGCLSGRVGSASAPSAASLSTSSAPLSSAAAKSPPPAQQQQAPSMELSELTAVSPIDGRYGRITSPLRSIFSEFGLIRYRIRVEIAWLSQMSRQSGIPEVGTFSKHVSEILENMSKNVTIEDARRVKAIESVTKHDLKAVEYFLKERFAGHPEIAAVSEFLHFACTSEDVNNLSYALMLQEARRDVLLPRMDSLLVKLREMSHLYASEPMLGRTHGQTASPTTVGKELANFVHRLQKQRDRLANVSITGKFNGAVGNFNAHLAAYPDLEWPAISKTFVEQDLGLTWQPYSTQIEPHDFISEMFDDIARFNTILIDLNRDMVSQHTTDTTMNNNRIHTDVHSPVL